MPDQAPIVGVGGTPLRRLGWLVLALALLYGAAWAYLRVPCWGIFGLAALAAWPIWAYRSANALFYRRLFLDGVALPNGMARRWLWRGRLIQSVEAVVAVALALALLAAASLLRPEHWAILALDVLLLSLTAGRLQRQVESHVRPEHAALVTRRWPLLALNLAFLAGAFFVIDFALFGAPDTRGLAWSLVAEQAFADAAAGTVCPGAGWAAGTLAAFEALTWHASQLAIPTLPDPALKLGAWLLFLAGAGLIAWLLTMLLLGTLVLTHRTGGSSGRSAATASNAFVYTILFLAVPYLYTSLKLRDFDPSSLGQGARNLVELTNPCRLDPARQALVAELDGTLARARADAIAAGDARIDAEVDALFAEVEQGVDAYLDWYFTVGGEYRRLIAAGTGGSAELLAEQIDRQLFAETGFEASLQQLMTTLATEDRDRLADTATLTGQRIDSYAAASPCSVDGIDAAVLAELGAGIERNDVLAVSTAAGTGVAAAAAVATAKILANKAAATVAGKLASKKGVQTVAVLAGKTAAKKGASALTSGLTATALCAPAGPAAIACGVVAGGITWLAVDKAVVEIDELRLRDDMRADLLAVLEEQRAALAAILKAQQAARIDAGLLQIQEHLGRSFVPMRDGI